MIMESHKGMVLVTLSRCNFDKSVYIENKFHHNTKDVFEYCKEKLSSNSDSGRTHPRVFHFLTPDQVIKKEYEKVFEGFLGTLKIRQVFKIKYHQIGIREVGCVCQNCRRFTFDNCDKAYVFFGFSARC